MKFSKHVHCSSILNASVLKYVMTAKKRTIGNTIVKLSITRIDVPI